MARVILIAIIKHWHNRSDPASQSYRALRRQPVARFRTYAGGVICGVALWRYRFVFLRTGAYFGRKEHDIVLPSIRNRVRIYLYLSSVVMIALLLLLFCVVQVIILRRQAVTDADVLFDQIGQVLGDNEKELERATADFKESAIRDARAAAYLVDENPDLVNVHRPDDSMWELRYIARLLGVSEIRIFNDEGELIISTDSDVVDLTFDDERMSAFKPMQNDRTADMCEAFSPDALDDRSVVYAAAWSAEYIVQVGVKPDAVVAVTNRNDSSRIFSMLNVNPGAAIYAVGKDGSIVGTTEEGDVGKTADEVGLPLSRLAAGKESFSVSLHGEVSSYCVVHRLTNGYIVYLESNRTLYHDMPIYCLIMFIALAIADLMLILVVHWYIRRHLIDSIDRVNASLTAIADGNLESNVNITDSREFSELSRHINQMVESILGNTDKISYVLQKANLNVGVYEYNRLMKQVRLTAGIGKLFGVSEGRMQELARNTAVFRHFVDQIRTNMLPDVENIYIVSNENETRFVKIEEINWGGDVFGVVVDMTEAVRHRKQLEEERDIDLLTGLYNRRGAETRLTPLFADPAAMAHGAIVMLDADELKIVNDRFGHDDGDRYLRKIADVLGQFSLEHRLAARVGGDEFVLLLHSYDTEEELSVALRLLQKAQENTSVTLHNGDKIRLKFSYGYQHTAPGADYNALLSAADTIMYENKRQRKELWKKNNA